MELRIPSFLVKTPLYKGENGTAAQEANTVTAVTKVDSVTLKAEYKGVSA